MKTIIRIKIDPFKVGKGHQPHRSGAGRHKHKGDRRSGNRSQQRVRAVSEF